VPLKRGKRAIRSKETIPDIRLQQ